MTGNRFRPVAWVAALLFAWSGGTSSPRAEDAPLVAAASDLQFALDEVAAAFARDTGRRIRLVLGSSGNFTRQIRQGAPFQLFLSADEEYVLALAREGLTEGDGVLYAIGRIALVAGPGASFEPDSELASLRAALTAGRIARFAIANPEHAPYGRRAEEALRHAGLWGLAEKRLVLGENVSQAAQFALSGNVDGGIVAYSLILSPKLRGLAPHALIPESWHSPLRQRMVLLRGAGPVARHFHAYIQQPPARAILREHGFALPGESG
ncbi:MAG: molybdate ABC transporter substrate-binding protein [Alphaproteobacteria bacterium]|nr:molybdate ABC transporter substrate-binding protein [Alphaproteobacteria bacterium]